MTEQWYVSRISMANPLELILINYELIFENIRRGRQFIENGDIENFDYSIEKARSYLMLLMSSLDMTFDLSAQLMSLYLYADRRMIAGKVQKNPGEICSACDILGSLYDAWKVIQKSGLINLPPVMENTEKIIAGYTLNGRDLSEYVIDDKNRGFLV